MNNNPRFNTPEPQSPDALKSEIETTRQRMDDTIDALTSRLKGRHLIDEVIGLFRSSAGNGTTSETTAKLKAKVSDTASSVLHGAVDTVKAHPLPALLVGAGIAWLIVEKSRQGKDAIDYDPDYDARYQGGGWEDDVPYDATTGYQTETGSMYASTGSGAPSGQYSQGNLSSISEGLSGAKGALGEKVSAAKGQIGDKLGGIKDQAGSKLAGARDQLRETSSRLSARGKEQARQIGTRVQAGYSATRQRVASTVESRPLESALGTLALGIVAGLLLPTPQVATDAVAPTAQRLRRRAREASHDLMERGRHVAEAAVGAVRETVEKEGLTPEALKEKIAHVALSGRDAVKDTAEEEGRDFAKKQGVGSGGSSAGSAKTKPASNGGPSPSSMGSPGDTPKSPPPPPATQSGF